MPSLITVYLLVSLENDSDAFGTKYEMHRPTCIYPNHQAKNYSYVVHNGKAERVRARRVLPSRCGEVFNRYKEKSALVAFHLLKSNYQISQKWLNLWTRGKLCNLMLVYFSNFLSFCMFNETHKKKSVSKLGVPIIHAKSEPNSLKFKYGSHMPHFIRNHEVA